MTSYQSSHHLQHRNPSLSFTPAADPEKLFMTNPFSTDSPSQHHTLPTDDFLPTNDGLTRSHFYNGLPATQATDSNLHWPTIYDLSSSLQRGADWFPFPYSVNTMEHELDKPTNGETLYSYPINSALSCPRSHPVSF